MLAAPPPAPAAPAPAACRCPGRRRASPLAGLAACALVLAYNLLGGVLFLALEGAPEPGAAAASQPVPPAAPARLSPGELRARTVERLWSITEDLNILYKENWTKLAAKELVDFQRVLMTSMRGPPGDAGRGGERGAAERDAPSGWTFAGSFLYALTLITTIGHGDVAPRSAAGRLAAVAYACVGIPLVMLYLATAGDALARAGRALYCRVRGAPAARPPRAPPRSPARKRTPFQAALELEALDAGWRGGRGTGRGGGEHTRVPLALSVALVALYVALGALVFRRTERWSLAEGCYFSFASLATIGFGDLRPGARAWRDGGEGSPRAEELAVGVCSAYILLGVALVAACVELARDDAAAVLRLLGAAGGGGWPPSPERGALAGRGSEEGAALALIS